MRQMLISETTESAINDRLLKLGVDNLVTITHLSTCLAPEKYSRYDIAITIVVNLEAKLKCLKREEL